MLQGMFGTAGLKIKINSETIKPRANLIKEENQNMDDLYIIPDITQTVYYCMISKIPIEFLKHYEGYLTLKSVKVFSNMAGLDFYVKFNNTGDMYSSQNGVTNLNKLFDKDYLGSIFGELWLFGTPNQTGSYYVSVIFTYIKAGVEESIIKDFKIDVVLPLALDNEYLIVKEEMLDLYKIEGGFSSQKCTQTKLNWKSADRFDSKL